MANGNGNGHKLTPKEQAFVVAYIGEAKGNGTMAVRLAGYRGNRNVLGVTAARMLSKPKIRGAIDTRTNAVQKPAIASFEERDEILSGIMRDGKLDIYARVAAARELNKCHGRHSIKMIHSTRTLEEILGESWKDE
jgi:phage terminase small subunit